MLKGILLRKKRKIMSDLFAFLSIWLLSVALFLHRCEAWTWNRSSRSSAASIVSTGGNGGLQTPMRFFQWRHREVVCAVIGLFKRSRTHSGGGELTLQRHWFSQAGSGIPEFCSHSSALSKILLWNVLSGSLSICSWLERLVHVWPRVVFRGKQHCLIRFHWFMSCCRLRCFQLRDPLCVFVFWE